MAVKASASVTLTRLTEVEAVTPYYILQSSTSARPEKPTTNPPPIPWSRVEPSYEGDITRTLYMTFLNELTDGSFQYTDVSVSSSYEAAKDAYARAEDGRKVAENYIHTDTGTNGLVVNNNEDVGEGYDVQLIASGADTGMNIRKDSEVLAHFGESLVELGKNSTKSQVQMCGGKAGVSTRYGDLVDIGSYDSVLDSAVKIRFYEDVFRQKVGPLDKDVKYYNFTYFDSESGHAMGWYLVDYVAETETEVNIFQYGVLVKTTDLHDGCSTVQIAYYRASHIKLFNTDTVMPSRKLELELAENSVTENDFANITIERNRQELESGDYIEHSIINARTAHDVYDGQTMVRYGEASIELYDEEVSIFATGGIYINGSELLDICHPVGEIFLTVDGDFNPNYEWGGTWVKLTADAYFKIVKTGGGSLGGTSSAHKIPLSSAPAHSHYPTGGSTRDFITGPKDVTVGEHKVASGTNTTYNYIYTGKTTDDWDSSNGTDSKGGGNAYYPYYYGVYAWKRTE
ncbi:MAG: hypothetical protein HUJ76_02920 [Parasporobacterium sp.]|nr:hypothetical protein [Parasporobacterium sp.]